MGTIDLSPSRATFLTRLAAMVRSEAPPSDIVAIYFGLFADEENHPHLYVVGSTSFDESDSDWACEDDDSWVPEERTFDLPALQALSDDMWEEIQGACAALLRGCRFEISELLGTPGGRPVALGWDDGDLEILFLAQT